MKSFPGKHFQAFLGIILAWVFLSTTLYYYHLNTQLADTAFAAQLLANLRHSWVMNTSMGISIVESMDYIWGRSAAAVCSMSLTSRLTYLPWFHYYLVMYLLAPFVRFIEIPLLIAITQAGIYLAVLIFTYSYSRRRKFSVLTATLLTVLVSQHPLWSHGLFGQYYFNRFFLPFSALFIWLLEKKKLSYLPLTLVGALAVSANEIYGITIFTIIGSYLWINRKFDKKLIVMSGLFLAYSLIAMYSIQNHLGLVSNQTDFIAKSVESGALGFLKRFMSDLTAPNTQIFLLVNGLFLGILTVFNPRTFLPLLIILAPNLLINIGGAEKTGWSTHYHISYFVPLIWLSIQALSHWHVSLRRKHIALSVLLLITVFVDPFSANLSPKPFVAVIEVLRISRDYKQSSGTNLLFREKLEQAVGKEQSASVLEPVAYHLYEHQIYYYPHNLEQVDNVILRYDTSKEGDARFSSISYGSQFDPQIDACIFTRMKKAGYDFENAIAVDGWAVIKRK